jgi:RNA polymerase sigma factor (sigma-70 family)
MAVKLGGGTPPTPPRGPAGAAAGPVSDAELIAEVRGGDKAAFAELYARHAPAATVVARQYAPRPADAEDIVAETFTRVFRLLVEGKGPDSFFRAYVFTAVRHLAASFGQAAQKVELAEDDAAFEGPGDVQEDPSASIVDRQIVRDAFGSLPERWRTALWYAEVEGLTTSQMAPALGLTPNGVAALLYRAREGLRQAYLQQHLAKPLADECRNVAGRLGAYARGALGQRERSRVSVHLDRCPKCCAVAQEAEDVNRGLRGVIAPLVLGSGPFLEGLISAIGGLPPVPGGPGPLIGASGGSAAAVPQPGPAVPPAAPLPPPVPLAASPVAGAPSSLGQLTAPVATKTGITGAATIASVAAAAIVAGVVVLVYRTADVPSAPDPSVLTPSPAHQSVADAAPALDEDALDLVFAAEGPLGITLAGAPLPHCPAGAMQAACEAPSAAEVILPDQAEVRYATLAWAAGTPGTQWASATLISPDGAEHAIVAAAEDTLIKGEQARADVTKLVAAGGAGNWSVGGAERSAGAEDFAGWSLTVVYEAPGLPQRRASVYQGALRVQAGTGKELDLDAPAGTAPHLGFVAWGADPERSGSDIWMSSGVGQEAVSQELVPNPFQGHATGFGGGPSPGVDVFALDDRVVFPRAEGAGTAVALRVRAWGDANESDPFTLGAVTLVADLPADSSVPE